MSIFGDFLKFIGSVVMGNQGASQKFLEPLSMAERYLRWGEERKDLRDFNSALSNLEQANDEDAPKPDLILKKYNIYCEATVGAIRVMLSQFQSVSERAKEGHSDMLLEQVTLREQIDDGKRKVAELKADGSLISAKEEQKRVDEVQTKLNAITRALESGDSTSKVMEQYDKLASESQRLTSSLEGAMASLEMNVDMPADVISRLRDNILSNLETIRSEVSALNPSPVTDDDGESDS
ncbi:MAG: hypothetical protein JXR97_15625 [Planctomycetes bacterium]|nr:hypothetical protein [Planctomycetota bacterium]